MASSEMSDPHNAGRPWTHWALTLSGSFLTVFAVIHIALQLLALKGQATFATWLTRLKGDSSFGTVVTLFLLALMLVHGSVGARAALAASPTRPGLGRTILASSRLQLVAGIIAGVFTLGHVGHIGWSKWKLGLDAEGVYDLLAGELSRTSWSVPWISLVYVIGLGAVCLHLGLGWFRMLDAFNQLGSRGRRLAARWGLGSLALILFLTGFITIIYFATGTSLLGSWLSPKGSCP